MPKVLGRSRKSKTMPKMTADELINHQMECLKMAQYYQFLLMFDPDNDDLRQGVELMIKFADRAKYRAMRIDGGHHDPAEVQG